MSYGGGGSVYDRGQQGSYSTGDNGGGGRGGNYAGSGVNQGGRSESQAGIPARFPHTTSITTPAAGYPTHDIQTTGNIGSGFSNLSSFSQSSRDPPVTFGQHLSGGQSLFPFTNPGMGSTPAMGVGALGLPDLSFIDEDLFNDLLLHAGTDPDSYYTPDTATTLFPDTSALRFQGPSNTLLHQFTPVRPAQAPSSYPQFGTFHTIGATSTTGCASTSGQSHLPPGHPTGSQRSATAYSAVSEAENILSPYQLSRSQVGAAPGPPVRESRQQQANPPNPPNRVPTKREGGKKQNKTHNADAVRRAVEEMDKQVSHQNELKEREKKLNPSRPRVRCSMCKRDEIFGECNYKISQNKLEACDGCKESGKKCDFGGWSPTSRIHKIHPTRPGNSGGAGGPSGSGNMGTSVAQGHSNLAQPTTSTQFGGYLGPGHELFRRRD